MVDRRDLGSWLQGPGTPADPDAGYPGQRLGRPETGTGSVAGPGRRLASIMIDWVLCLLIAQALHRLVGPQAGRPSDSLWPLGVLVVENLLLVATAGATLGQRLVGVRVERVDGGHPGLGASLVRAVLLGLALPALTLLWQHDRRGLHELASGSLVAVR